MARASSKSGQQGNRSGPRLGLALGLSVLAFLGYKAITEWRDDHALLINTTQSLPNWAFIIYKTKQPARGEYVFFTPPPHALVRRHFGDKPQPFGKLAYGLPGDVVGHSGSTVTINGKPVAQMKPLTSLGESLTPGMTGTIPQGCYFLGTPHKDGFDSRYAEIGLVCRRQIIGTGFPVL